MIGNKVASIYDTYPAVCRRIFTEIAAPRPAVSRFVLFAAGFAILLAGYAPGADAALGNGQITYNDERITAATNAVLTYLEGSFGALVMVASGIGCIISAAFGQYRSAIGLMVVAIGSFILRSLVSTFFNDQDIQG